jgi:DNA polymerase IIIc chi subunit
MQYEVVKIFSFLVDADSKEEALERFAEMKEEHVTFQDETIEVVG